MTNLVQLPNPRQVREQAALWLVSLEEGLSEEERARLTEWLEADAAHRQALVRMAEHWDEFDALAELAEILPLHQRRQRTRAFTLKVAGFAVLAIGLAASGFYVLLEGKPASTTEAASVADADPRLPRSGEPLAGTEGGVVTQQLRTAVGKQLATKLPDGSTLTLNTDTLLEIEFSAAERLVTLTKGEAIFTVAHDVARPFRVRVGDRLVQAVGTVFGVKRDTPGNVRVTVSEGTVKVLSHSSATQGALMVTAGELAVVGDVSTQVRRIEAAQIDAIQAWQHGMLVYQGETLDAVLADVSRYTTVRFSIADASIRNKRVGGIFRTGDVDGLLLALRESFGIEPRREGDVIVLTAKR